MSDDANPPRQGPAENPDQGPQHSGWEYDATQQRPVPPGEPSYGAPQPPPYGQGYDPQFDQQGTGGYPGGQDPTAQYPGAQYPASQYPASQYPTAQYPGGQYPGAPYPGTGYSAGQFPPGQYPGYPGGKPPSSGPSTGLIVGIVLAVVAVLAVAVGVGAWLLGSRSHDDVSALSASSATSEAPWSTESSTDVGYAPYSPSYTPSYPTSTTSSIDYYGSIAVSRVTGDIGYSINNLTQEAAVSAALSKCGVSSCETVLRFWNACGAVAQSPVNLYWGWGWAPTRQGAIDQATSHVEGANPRLLTVQCTTNAQS